MGGEPGGVGGPPKCRTTWVTAILPPNKPDGEPGGTPPDMPNGTPGNGKTPPDKPDGSN